MKHRRLVSRLQILLIPALLGPSLALSSPAQAETQAFSHADWDAVLAKFVDEQGRVDYQGLAKDRAVFDRYLAAIEAKSPRSHPALFPRREDALAYYLNAYNAQVLKGVLKRGPETKTVWTPFGTGYSFFVGMDITVGGETTNLKALEDEVVRAEFQDPRIHAALNCASIGCPHLPRKAFEPDALDSQLQAEMAKFIGQSRNCAVDAAKRTVSLSKIFEWFADDFLAYERRQGNASPKILDYINRFRPEDQKIPGDFTVRYFDYDKGLNSR